MIVIDIGMPGLGGIEATHLIIHEAPDTKVIALSMHSDRRFVAEMLKAGASGYLSKDCAFDELAHAINTVVTDQFYLGPGIASVVVKDYVHHLTETDLSTPPSLTSREREVLQLLAEGKSTRQIASDLHMGVSTVATHRQHIMEKLDINNIAGLIKYAIRAGLTSPEP